MNVALELGRGQRGHAVAHATQPVFGIQPVHRVPLGLDELPRQLPGVDGHEQRAGHERRVLCPDLAVDGLGECLLDERARRESGQGVEIALLFLGRPRRAEALDELRVARGVSGPGEDGDERGQHVGIDRPRVGERGPVELGRACLGGAVVAQRAGGAQEITA